MSSPLRLSVACILIQWFALSGIAADPSTTLRERIQQVLDDPDLRDAERFQALREVIDDAEVQYLTENSLRWVRALGGSDFDARREAREQLTHAGVHALAALEDGVRTGDQETSVFCWELIGRLVASEEHSEVAMQALERLAEHDDESIAAKASVQLASIKELQAERVRQEAINLIESIGGRVTFARTDPGGVRRIVLLQGGGFDDAMMSRLAAFPELENLWLHDSKITDAGMEHLAQLPNLQHLSLDNARITDDGIAVVSELTGLENLSLQQTDVSDDGLRHLLGLRNLTDLDLNRTKVTDAGLSRLKDLPNLERLSLGLGGSVTDDGLRVLQEFPRLKSLSLGTDFSDRGVQNLMGIANLERLSFINCEGVTDAGLQQLSSITTLKHLSIYSRSDGITDAGIEELQQALPELEIGGLR